MTRIALSDTIFSNANLSYTHQGVVTPEGELIDGFLASVCNETGGLDTLDQIAELEEILSLSILSSKHNMEHHDGPLRLERNTWRLVGRLYHDELMQRTQNTTTAPFSSISSEKEIIEHAFITDKQLRRAQVIVDWLEYNARKDLELEAVKVPPESTLGWENTLAVLLGKINARTSSDLVSCMDPDAPVRQMKSLQDLDNRDENELARLLYIYIRSGMLESAQEICEHSGQPWRAVTLNGWKLYHDPNLATNVGSGTTEIKPTEGNLNRDLWKRVALRMTQDANLSRYVRAAYSALCGNINVLKSVCVTWDDFLWAYTKCLVDISVELRIREALPRPLCELPAFYWENKRTINAVFDAVDASNVSDGNKIFCKVQKLLILNEVQAVLEVIDEWAGCATSDDRQILRFFAHLVIILKRLDPKAGGCSGHECIRRYCEYLMETRHIQQVAWYVSQLSGTNQIDLYSRFLETLSHEADKRLALTLAVENSLPIHQILSRVVQQIHSYEASGDDETHLIVKKIEAIDWLLYDPKQMDEAMERTNLLVRKLKATGKDEAARCAFEKLPDSATETVMRYCLDDDGIDQITPKQRLVIKECLCWSAYFCAKASFDRWFEHFNKEKPQVPVSRHSQHLTKQVTQEKQTLQYNISLDQWKATQESLAKEASDKLMAVVTFSDGWMAEPEGDLELTYLRKLCIPELILLLHTVLHTTQSYKQAMQLADVVASEVHGLYECFHKENMRIFLNKIKQSAVAQLEPQ